MTSEIDILKQAEVIFGSYERALIWLSKPKTDFQGKSPLEVLKTPSGYHKVEELLIQIDEGYY